jgi:hypothetical protein
VSSQRVFRVSSVLMNGAMSQQENKEIISAVVDVLKASYPEMPVVSSVSDKAQNNLFLIDGIDPQACVRHALKHFMQTLFQNKKSENKIEYRDESK